MVTDKRINERLFLKWQLRNHKITSERKNNIQPDKAIKQIQKQRPKTPIEE